MQKIKRFIVKFFKRKGSVSFIDSIVFGGKILDVGCGNNGPYKLKSQRPDLYYVGLDIGIYNQDSDYVKYADEFILAEPRDFHKKIEERPNTFDAIICTHNLEHCDNYIAVTLAIIKALKKDGTVYISFPCEASVNFPSRKGITLNFYDDKTHQNIIPYDSFISLLKDNGLEIIFSIKRYRPLFLFLAGLIFEPYCIITKRKPLIGGSWSLYGFETIIVAKKK